MSDEVDRDWVIQELGAIVNRLSKANSAAQAKLRERDEQAQPVATSKVYNELLDKANELSVWNAALRKEAEYQRERYYHYILKTRRHYQRQVATLEDECNSLELMLEYRQEDDENQSNNWKRPRHPRDHDDYTERDCPEGFRGKGEYWE